MQKKPAHTTERCSPLRLVSNFFDEKKPGNEMTIPNDQRIVQGGLQPPIKRGQRFRVFTAIEPGAFFSQMFNSVQHIIIDVQKTRVHAS